MTRDLAGSAVPGHHHLLLAPVHPGLGGHGEDDGSVSGSGHHGPGEPDGLIGLATVSLHLNTRPEWDSQVRGQGPQGLLELTSLMVGVEIVSVEDRVEVATGGVTGVTGVSLHSFPQNHWSKIMLCEF